VSDWQLVWLATIAVAVVVMAVVQVAVVLQAARMARQAAETAQELRRELRPLLEKAHRIADEAARATALATLQVERVDRLLSNAAERVDEAFGLVQSAVVEPLKQGSAFVTALRAAFTVFRSWQERPGRHSRDEDEALFVG
jgi:uncharacterized protein YoxC